MTYQRFLIAINGAPSAQVNAFAAAVVDLKADGIGWWHHVPSFWIVIAPEGKTSTSALRDLAGKHIRSGVVFVCLFTNWSGRLPVAGKSEEWLKQHLNATEASD